MSKKYQLGTLVKIRGEFRSSTGEFIDPTTVSCEVTGPSASPTTYTYPASITKDAVGRYHLDISPTAGKWSYRFVSTGIGQGADSGKFEIKA
jgi:hypothetical protein